MMIKTTTIQARSSTNPDLLKTHVKGVRKRVCDHNADHSIGGSDCRNSDAKENKANVQGFPEQKEALI